MIDLRKLRNVEDNLPIEPRNIFMGLPKRGKKYEYPRDVQTEVWKQWFELRNEENCIIKMNTGSGKTIVGLMILRSCLNENVGRAMYVVPDNFLVGQVCDEAKKLGIDVTDDPEDYNFLIKKSILVTNIYSLVNGKSKFGMRDSNNIDIGSIIIDDVHACLTTIEEQYRISIPVNSEMYNEIVKLFEDDLKKQSENKLYDIIEKEDIKESMLIPYWAWQKKQHKIHQILSSTKNSTNTEIQFKYPLIKDVISLCNCMINSKSIEISPPCIPINKIKSFSQAKRKIFMSATLYSDNVFATALGIDDSSIQKIVSPEKANDLGERLILFPQVINKSISDTDIKKILKQMSKKINIVVIVPSRYRAEFWDDAADLIIDSSNIDISISQLKVSHIGLVIIINKYDGIDLPDDACRMLVIDGLPNIRSQYEAYEQNALHNNTMICSEQIQKIEQGMGRGVRSNTDYCTIVLMGRGLADVIYASDGKEYFSNATKSQFELSESLWSLLDEKTLNNIFEISKYSLLRDEEWIELSRNKLSEVKYPTKPNFDSSIIAIRKAFEKAETESYNDAVTILEKEKNNISDKETVGLFKQYMSTYLNFVDAEKAQQMQLSAHNDNKMLLKPLSGIQFDKIINKTGVQSRTLVNYLTNEKISPNKYILMMNSLLDKLVFSVDSAKIFEQSIKDISFLLGIFSNRPEDEYGKGPDNFWDLGDSSFLVIECKNGTITETISKHDCNQLNGSINWFDSIYHSDSCICYPIMIHNSNIFEYACSPDTRIKIMTPDLLEKLKKNILEFSNSFVLTDNYSSVKNTDGLLRRYNLFGTQIVETYTTDYIIKGK